jgi:L-ascorbate metabolism protein UlaG (beta-lactamase superfamily)
MTDDLGFRLTWYGHSAIRVETPGGTTVLVDPWLRNPNSVVDPDSIERCDLMLVTHGHHDHLGSMPGEIGGADSLTIARRTRPVWPCVHELSLWLEAQGTGAEVVGMNKGGAVQVRDVRVTMVHADHSAGDWSADLGVPVYLGEPAGFVLELDTGPRLYLSGDTALFGDMRLIAEMYRPEVAFLPIGGHYTMDPPAAARAVELIGATTVIPIHYGTFPVLTGTPAQLRDELEGLGLGDVHVVVPEIGVPLG